MSHEGLGPDNSVCKTAFVAAMKAQILADQAAAVVDGDQEKADALAQTAANMDKPEYQKNIEPLAEAVYQISATHANTAADNGSDPQFWQWMADVTGWLKDLSAWQQGVAHAFSNWAAAGGADINFRDAVKGLADPGQPPALIPAKLSGRIE
jgi:hypothetical protein